MLEKEAARLNLDVKETLRAEHITQVTGEMNYQHEEDLLAGIGYGHVAASTVLNKIRAQEPPKPQVITGRPMAEARLRISAGGMDDLAIHRSRCCMPLPGEEVVGYITRGKGMAIHREGCSNIQDALHREPDRIQRVDWTHSSADKFSVPIRIDTMDRVGVAADVTAAFSERKINIEQAKIRTMPGGSAVWELLVDVADVDELEQIVRVVSSIPDVLSVTRPGPRAK